MRLNDRIHHFLQLLIDCVFNWLIRIVDLFRPITSLIVSGIYKTCAVQLNGNKSCDIQVNDERFYALLLCKAGTGFFESYIKGYIDVDDLEQLVYRSIASPIAILGSYHPYSLLKHCVHKYFDILTQENVQRNLNGHYDESAAIVKMTTDSTFQYSTMLLNDEKKIDESTVSELSQLMNEGTVKMRNLIAEKLNVKAGMKVLDIGCGFGGLAKHLASKNNVHVTGVTVSFEMAKHATEACKDLDVKIKLCDYRAITGKFDRIVCIEMFEHIGDTHHKEFFRKAGELLVDNGLLLLQSHCVSGKYMSMSSYDPLFEQILKMYAYFPRPEQIFSQSKGLFVIEDLHNFGMEAGITAKAVVKTAKAKQAEIIQKFGEKKYKEYLLCNCIGSAAGRTKRDHVLQILFSKSVTDDQKN